MRLQGGAVPDARLVVFVVLFVLAIGTIGLAFSADLGDASPDPVNYADTVELGLSSETDDQMAGAATIPKAQVFYSQFQYVVGYNGIETALSDIGDDRTDEQFGYPIAVYVQDFGTGALTLTDEGYLDPGSGRFLGWTPATEAHYVVGSDARTPAGETVVPFESATDAEAFTAQYGGEITDWEGLSNYEIETATVELVRNDVLDRAARADATVEASIDRIDRPESIVVGEDEPTLQAAIEAAPPETTVVIPPGVYEETVEIDRSITLLGTTDADSSTDADSLPDVDSSTDADSPPDVDSSTEADVDRPLVVGNRTGSVIDVNASDVGIVGIDVAGTGNQTRDEDAVGEPADDEEEAWDTNIQLGYGHGDAGIRAVETERLHVEDVRIETNASGVLLRSSPGAVIRSTHVDGTDEWLDGFMGVVSIESPVTIEDSTFVGGRDGVYVHRSDETVVRNSTFYGGRYGVHLMYTSDSLIADNVAREQEFGGVTVMTRPEGNAIVGNDIRQTSTGISASGVRTYIGHNVLADNGLGFGTSSRQSLYEHNVLVDNEMGVRATTVVPSSLIVGNDFVGNDQHASSGAGPLRIWTDRDRGNYWEGAYGTDRGGVYDRAYSPSSAVDAALHRDPSSTVLAEAPAVRALRELLGTTPGMRSGSVIDTHPSTEPFAPEILAELRSDGPDETRSDEPDETRPDEPDETRPDEPIDVDWESRLGSTTDVDDEQRK